MTRFSRSPRPLGSLVAAALAIFLCLVQLAAGARWDPSVPMSMVLPMGVPIGATLGWRHAPAIARDSTISIRVVSAFAVQAIVLGAALVNLGWALFGDIPLAEPGIRGIVAAVAGGTFVGVIFFGIPMLGLTLPAAAIWAATLRWLLDKRPHSAVDEPRSDGLRLE